MMSPVTFRDATCIACLGECMLEISAPDGITRSPVLPGRVSFGGDTLNTSVYLARQGIPTHFVTALGDDEWSDWLVERWREEQVDCSLVVRRSGRLPGMYAISLDDNGERRFQYWREQSAARTLLDDPEAATELLGALTGHAAIYLSGITLAILSDAARATLFDWLSAYRDTGGVVIFDGNYRPRLWAGEQPARSAYQAAWSLTDIALPTYEDEQLLWGDTDHAVTLARLLEFGCREICLKDGANGALLAQAGQRDWVEPRAVANVRDTTAAGDSFNAGYIAARLKGEGPVNAARAGHALAGTVIQHPGAIIAPEFMPTAAQAAAGTATGNTG